jgi:hypothetical protein
MLKKNKKEYKLVAKMILLGSHQTEKGSIESERFEKKEIPS